MRALLRILATATALVVASPGWALPPASEIMRRVATAHAGIQDYTVDVDVHVQMPNLKIPDISVRVYHKRPDKTKLKPLKGFAIVPRGSLPVGDPLARFREHFSPQVQGKGLLEGRPVYLLRLVPKGDASSGPVQAWVDCERWLVLRLRSLTPMGDPVVVGIAYRRHGQHWLPSRSVARVVLPNPGPAHGRQRWRPPAVRERHRGTVTATFRNYRVNGGLPDSLFEERAERPEPAGPPDPDH